MAEAFSNKITRTTGIVSTSTDGTCGVTTTWITGISTVGVGISHIVDNQHFRAGTKISSIGIGTVVVDTASYNTVSASNQVFNFLGPTTCYTSPSSTKSILIGGTFANLSANTLNLTVELHDASAGVSGVLAANIPVPTGSSFVISDAGKSVLESLDEVRVYCTTKDAVDVNLSILTGVS
jgi:hypothetical protein